MILDGRGVILFITEQGMEKSYDIKPYRDTRSGKANRYFHRLVGLLAKGEDKRFYEKKNELILQYGNHQIERNKDGSPAYDLLPDNDDYRSHPVNHYMPTEYTDDFRGMKVRAFIRLAGTHTYDSAEMATLIESTRNECLGCGIPIEHVETFEERRILEEMRCQS